MLSPLSPQQPSSKESQEQPASGALHQTLLQIHDRLNYPTLLSAGLLDIAARNVPNVPDAIEFAKNYHEPEAVQMELELAWNEVGDSVSALETDDRSNALSALLLDALRFGPILPRSAVAYLTRLSVLFGDTPLSAAVVDCARSHFLICVEKGTVEQLDCLEILSILGGRSFVETDAVRAAVEARILQSLESALLEVGSLMTLPGFKEARDWLKYHEPVREALANSIEHHLQRENIYPEAVLTAIDGLDLPGAAHAPLFRGARKLLAKTIKEGDLLGANHALVLLPRDHDDLLRFSSESAPVVARHRNAVRRLVLRHLRFQPLDPLTVSVVRESIKNFIGDTLADDRKLVAALVRGETDLLKQRPLPAQHLLDLLPERERRRALADGELQEAASSALHTERVRVNTKVRALLRSPAPEHGDALEEFEAKASSLLRKQKRIRRLAQVFDVVIGEQEDLSKTFRTKAPVQGLERLFKDRDDPFLVPWSWERVSISRLSWNAMRDRAYLLYQQGHLEEAHAYAGQLRKVLGRTGTMEGDAPATAEILQLHARTCPNPTRRHALLTSALRFTLRTQGISALASADALDALAVSLRDRGEDGRHLQATAHLVRSLHRTPHPWRRAHYLLQLEAAYKEAATHRAAEIDAAWLRRHVPFLDVE